MHPAGRGQPLAGTRRGTRDDPDRAHDPMPPRPAGDRPTDPSADQAPVDQGILPGLLATFTARPPERGLFRELVQQTVGRGVHRFDVGGQQITAATIKGIAWTLYGRMNDAGLLVDPKTGDPWSRQTLADDASVSRRTLVTGLAFLDAARCTGRRRGRGRRRDVISINPGGLTWPAVRKRITIAIKAREDEGEGAAAPYRPTPLPLSEPRIPLASTRAGSAPQTPRSSAEPAPLEGHVRTGQISEPIAAAGTSRASTADRRRQEQQQPGQTNRIEGLIGAIAARSRSLARPFDEATARRDLASGKQTVNDLQRQADALDAECIARPFADPATGRRVQRNPEAIAASVGHQRRLAADEGRPFDEAAARLEAERADDRHLARCLALGDTRQERAGEDSD